MENLGKHTFLVGLRSSDSSSVSQILYFRDVTHETEVDRMKSEFLSTAAHELRTPMASIFGFTELLISSENDAATQREFLDIIYRQSKLMIQILEELLDLARIEARGGKDFRYTRICAQDVVADVIKGFKSPEGRSPPAFDAPAPAIFLMADVGKLRQAVLNVLVNAYKFSPLGGEVLVAVDMCKPDANTPEMLCIHITDHGMGMTGEQLAKVGTRFYRADASGQVAGSGLGVSIVKEIISLHKGQVTIESTLGEGTKVTLWLPIGTSSSTQPAQLQ